MVSMGVCVGREEGSGVEGGLGDEVGEVVFFFFNERRRWVFSIHFSQSTLSSGERTNSVYLWVLMIRRLFNLMRVFL